MGCAGGRDKRHSPYPSREAASSPHQSDFTNASTSDADGTLGEQVSHAVAVALQPHMEHVELLESVQSNSLPPAGAVTSRSPPVNILGT